MKILEKRNKRYEEDLKTLDVDSVKGKLSTYMNSTLDNVTICETIPGTPKREGDRRKTSTPRKKFKTISSTPYTELKRELGNGDTRLGSEIFKTQKERLKRMFVDLLTMKPEDRPLYFGKVDRLGTSF